MTGAPDVAPRRMRLVSFKPMVKGALRGFATVELPNGLKIVDCTVCISHGKTWAAFPGKPQLDQAGHQIVVDGRKQYTSILAWPDRDVADRWSAAVVDLVLAEHPHALEAGGDP